MWYKLWHIRKTNLQFAICNFHSSLFYFSRVYNNQSMNAIFRPIIFNGTAVTLILNFFFNFRSTSSDLPPLWLRCDSAFSSTDIPPIAVSLPSSKGSSLSLPYSQLSTPEKLQIANCKLQIHYFLFRLWSHMNYPLFDGFCLGRRYGLDNAEATIYSLNITNIFCGW